MRYKWTPFIKSMFLDLIMEDGELDPIGSVAPHAHGWEWKVYGRYDQYASGVCHTKWGAMAKLLRFAID